MNSKEPWVLPSGVVAAGHITLRLATEASSDTLSPSSPTTGSGNIFPGGESSEGREREHALQATSSAVHWMLTLLNPPTAVCLRALAAVCAFQYEAARSSPLLFVARQGAATYVTRQSTPVDIYMCVSMFVRRPVS